MKNLSKITVLLIFFIGLIKFSGYYLDKRAEQEIENRYQRDASSGVIDGLQSRAILHGKKQALLFVHGFGASPDLFSEVINDIQSKVNYDIYVPLLPFHGRNLQAMKQFDNHVILHALDEQVQALAKQYKTVVIVGMSYGGALISALAHESNFPKNAQLVLYSPGLFIIGNTRLERLEARLYGWWRSYCNYEFIGCKHPNYDSGDAEARGEIEREKSLRYIVAPALLQLYKFDSEHQSDLATLNRPFDLIVAKDDNRVSYDLQKAACQTNSNCHLYAFSSGKHLLHWGANKKQFERLLISISQRAAQ